MKKHLLSQLCLTVGLGLGMLHASHVQFPADPPQPLQDSLQVILDQEISASNAVGGILGVHKPQSWAWFGSSGNATLNPVSTAQPTASFRAASISKSFVAAALLNLQEQNTLDLDDPITNWIDPTLAGTINNASQITIRQLLNHTSGIADYVQSNTFKVDFILNGVNHTYTPGDLVGYGTAQGASFLPGAGWEYSNTNYVLAAMVIDSAANQSYETYIQNELLTPLGLSDTYFPTTPALAGNAMGMFYDITGNGTADDISTVPPSSMYGSGPLVSTMEDMMVWMESLESESLLSASSYQEMKTYVPSGISGFTYGLGLQAFDTLGFESYGHMGGIFNSSNLQYEEVEDFYAVYNVTNKDFAHEALFGRLTSLIEMVNDSCANFAPALNLAGQIGFIPGSTVTLDAPIANNYEYDWTMNQMPVGNGQPSLQATQPGTYELKIRDGWGCESQVPAVQLAVCTFNLQINPGADTLYSCFGLPVSLQAGSPGDSINWLNVNGSTLFLNNQNFNYGGPLPVTIVAQGFDGNGCMGYDTVHIQAGQTPTPDLGTDIYQCPGTPVSFTEGGPADSVNWYDGNGMLLLSGSKNYSFNLNTTSEVIVEVINDCGTAYDTVLTVATAVPTVDLGSDLDLCEGDTLVFPYTAPYDSINWYHGDGTLVSANTSFYYWEADTSIQLIVEIFSDCGGVGYDTIDLNVAPLPIIDVNNYMQACEGTVVSIIPTTTADSMNFKDLWGTMLAEDQFAYDQTLTVNTFIVIEGYLNGCGPKRDTVELEPFPTPNVYLGPDVQVCENDPYALSVNFPTSQVDWYDLNGNLLSSGLQSLTVQVNTTKTIIVAVSDNCGEVRDTITLEAVPLPMADLGQDIAGCLGTVENFTTGTPSDIVDWYDMNGNPLAQDQQTYAMIFAQDGEGLIAEVTNSCGTDRDTVYFTATDRTGLDLISTADACRDEPILLTAGQPGDAINWEDAQGNILMVANSQFTYDASVSKTIFAEFTDQCGNELRDTVVVTVHDRPTISLGPDYVVDPGHDTLLVGGLPTDSVNWYDGFGTLLLADNPDYQVTYTQNVTIVVEQYPATRVCAGYDTLVVEVKGLVESVLPSMVDKFEVYPNPSYGQIQIDMDLQQGADITFNLYNLQGQLVKTQSIGVASQVQHPWTLRGLAAGVYLLQVQVGHERLTTKIELR
ncbi:serine hydrolase [Pontibacter sp. G13]|uniref:serine hydrolase n=1 Tax=Pontibacter sp. G13 TaxID=3074898 RepID=UPI00288BC91A|nr:serine hydrolase [Pontibacter sp. G13]WNJ19910.1 serine hydrolase [Pontibacter sp. G13]